ncbi:MAG: hypothetical protein OEY45_09810 [Gammaproteobacteria bacterium]|nr:hypothetical protein [Gammaproteobacteria bacterium]
MDCYIVRVYRHVTHKNGQDDEIAGLVERVGNQDNGKPFSTYKGLLEAIRDSFKHAPEDAPGLDDRPRNKLCMVKPVRGG